MSYKKLLTILPCAAIWVALPPKAKAHQEQAQQQAGQQGMVVARDPQTGELRAPTPAESRALAAQPASSAMRAPSQPMLVTHPGGAKHVRLGEQGLVYSVVKRGADGKLSEQCLHGEAAAEKAVNGAALASPSASPSASTSAAAHTEEHDHD